MLKAQFTLDPPPGVQRVSGSARATGTGYHAGLEVRYVARRDGTVLPTIDDMIGAGIATFDQSLTVDLYDNSPVDEFKWDDNIPDQATGHDFISRMVRHYMTEGCEWPEDWTVLGVEVHQNVDDPEVGVQTKFGADLVMQAPDGGIVVDDQKTAGKPWNTGKESPRKNVQAPFYLRLARKIYPDAPYYRFVFSVMTLPRPKAGITFQRLISDPQHEAAIVKRARAFRQVYTMVHEGAGLDLPANPNSTLCNPKYCDYWKVCPYGAALESD